MRARTLASLAAAIAVLVIAPATFADTPAPTSSTVIGSNPLLSDGAAAMMSGDWERGVQLTQMGMNMALSQSDRAAAYANLCAGYAAMKKYERALENCAQSISLDEKNWRAWQNRAAAHLGLGKIDDAIRDIQRGLQINPASQDLQKTLAIAREYEKLQQERLRNLLES